MDATSKDRLDTIHFGLNIRKRKTISAALIAAGDMFSIASSIGITEVLNVHRISISTEHFGSNFSSPILLLSTAILLMLFGFLGHYFDSRPIWKEIRQILNVLGITACIAGTLLFFTDSTVEKSYFSTLWISCLILLPCQRIAVKRILIAINYNNNGTVILGTGKNALSVAQTMLKDPLMRHELVGFVALPNLNSNVATIKISDRIFPVSNIYQSANNSVKSSPTKIIVALEDGEIDEYHSLTSNLENTFLTMEFVSTFYGFPSRGVSVHKHFGQDMLSLQLQSRCDTGTCQLLKRAIDVSASALLLAILSPLLAFLLWKTINTCGSPIFGHERVGRNGKIFKCYKFRTMVKNADSVLNDLLNNNALAKEEWENTFKLKDDPRVTSFGKFLRTSSLDELPQLWNVIKGDMSLVGPRPVVKNELIRYGDNAKYYLQTKPGLTGLWQISGRSNTTYDRRVYLDTWYVKNWCLKNDILIILKTIPAVLKGSGAC